MKITEGWNSQIKNELPGEESRELNGKIGSASGPSQAEDSNLTAGQNRRLIGSGKHRTKKR